MNSVTLKSAWLFREQGRLLLERERVGKSRRLLVEDGGLTVGTAIGSPVAAHAAISTIRAGSPAPIT